MKKLILFSGGVFLVVLLAALRNQSTHHIFKNDNLKIEETFLSLDSVWTPGKRQKFGLHPFDNYLWIKDGIATFIVDEVRGNSFRGPINNINVVNTIDKVVTSFSVRNANMKVEIHALGNDRFEIFTYNYLDTYERMFTAYWVDVSKIEFSEEAED
jgi:hypothetical protein